MSHFSVIVIGPNPETQLAPYQENNMGDCPKEYLEFHDVEDEYRKEYEEDTRQEFYCSSSSSAGQVVDQDFFNVLKKTKVGHTIVRDVKNKGMFDSYWKFNNKYRCNVDGKENVWVEVVEIVNTTHPDPAVCFTGIVKLKVINPPREIKHKDQYPDFESFMEDWAGYKKKDETYNRYGYWENPNAKWDYYTLGGRYRGKFQLKPKHAYAYGVPEKSWEWTFDEESLKKASEKDNGLFTDQCLKGEIDFENMRKRAGEKAGQEYDFVMSFLKDTLPNETWEAIRDDKNVDESRKTYWTQPRCVKWREVQKIAWDLKKEDSRYEIFSYFGGSPDEFLISREQYVENAQNSVLSAFAVVKDGKWYEKGEMGWWGMVGNEKDAQTWQSMFWNLIKELPDDTLLSCFDCHI